MPEWDEEQRLKAMNEVRERLGLPKLGSVNGRDPRAVAKLTLAERCEILAFCLRGVPTQVVAAAFDVSVATVRRIKSCGTNDSRYEAVMVELMKYNNNKEFCDAKITEENERVIRDIYPTYPPGP